MFTSLEVQHFRNFSRLAMSPLARVNLIVGKNNVGKTALLEAIYLLIGEHNVTLAINITGMRGLDKLSGDIDSIGDWLWTPLFNSFDTSNPISISGKQQNGELCTLTLRLVSNPRAQVVLSDRDTREVLTTEGRFTTKALEAVHSCNGTRQRALMIADGNGISLEPPSPSPSSPGYFLAARARISLEEDARHLGQLEISKQPFDILEVLRIIEPRLTRIRAVVGPTGPTIYGDIGLDRMLPLALLGDGLNRFTTIVLRMATARNGTVLVDEIENGLHHSVMDKIWAALAEAAIMFNVQLFATTHSWECVEAARQAYALADDNIFRLHRLERTEVGVRAVTYDAEAFVSAVEAEIEVR